MAVTYTDLTEGWGRTSPHYRAAYPFLRLLLTYSMRALAPRLRISGRQHVPLRGPVIIAPNHLADADPPLIATASPRPMWYMGKRDLFEWKSIAPTITFWRTFPVDPGNPDRAALRLAEDLLTRGQAVVIFPEGKISENGELGSILPGTAMLALRSGAPVVPVAIRGSHYILPYAQTLPRLTLKRVRVHFGPAITFGDLAELPNREQRTVAAQRIDSALRRTIAAADRSGG